MLKNNLFTQDTLRISVTDTVIFVFDTLHLNLTSSINLVQEDESLVRTIEKNGSIELAGSTGKHPKEAEFKIKIKYSDREKYQYESIIDKMEQRYSHSN